MSSFRFLVRPLFNTVKSQPFALIAYKNAFIRPAMKKTFLQPATLVTANSKRAFSVAVPRLSSGDVDPDLVHLLDEELQFETTETEAPAFIKEFLDTNLFQIEDKVGHDKVTLTRTFGNEKINVIFSISDINNTVEEFTEEELQDGQEIIEKDTTDIADEKKATAGEEEVTAIKDQDLDNASFPVRATVIIEKQDKGSLVLNTVAQDGYLHIDAVRYFKQGQIQPHDMTTVDIGEQRQDLYMGPVFDELEEQIQTTFSRYLEERGIDTALATFLPDYVDYKEQKEYVNWLKDVNDFVSA
ncbi:mitochondrial acidic protein MAM33 [Mucor ambiguus]|uniref:Mitochondrial acidic protein MAM33 n=1 Tax=Mucor ambiguus TaxID=91626 RepID=A0A0C9MF38_9FUNG|nr:mitochondrial acidic protein MAM33 [Mucor ambiguus]